MPKPPQMQADRDVNDFVRTLVDHVPSMLAYWDSELRCRFANHAYERWFGVDPNGLIGTSLRDLLGPELYVLNEPHIQGVLRGEEQYFERVIPGPGGIKRHSLAVYIPDIVQGRVLGFTVQVSEVTKLKEVEASLRAQIETNEHAYAQLRRSEQALREAQQLGQIGSWEWHIEPDTVSWSEELFHIFGLDPAGEAPGVASQAPLFTPASWKVLSDILQSTLTTGEPYVIELEYVKADKRVGWMEARGTAVRDDSGQIVRLHGTAMDITARRLMQEARVQRDIAEASNRNKTKLLSRISHELRTPLNGIMGYAQLNILDPLASETQRQRNEVVLSCGQHMLQLVDDILDLSSAELGHMAVRCLELNLQDIVHACLADFIPIAARAKVDLVNLIGRDQSLQVLGDPTRVRQIINNLVSNAIKYNRPHGQVAITASIGDSHIDLQIEDSGIGMSEAQLARIFTPFDRLGAEHSDVEGAGLGLALSHALAGWMGGTILVESHPGQGSRFTLRLARCL